MTNHLFFPGLGLEFDLNRVAFEVLGRPVYWYGIIIASGLLLAVFLCGKWGKRFGVTEDQIIDMMLFAVPVALVAIRVYYVVFNLGLFRNADGSLNWRAILNYGDGGLAIYGAIISSILVLLIFCKVRKINFLAFADLGVHGLFIGQLVGRWGNFMNVEAYGGLTTLPWRMCSESIAGELWGQGLITTQEQYTAIVDGSLGVHPTFFYESVWNFVGLLLVYQIGRRRKFDGQCFWFYLFWYGLGRMWIEGLRTDSLYLYEGSDIRVSQLVAALSAVAAAGVFLWMWLRAKNRPTELYVNKLAAQREKENPLAPVELTPEELQAAAPAVGERPAGEPSEAPGGPAEEQERSAGEQDDP